MKYKCPKCGRADQLDIYVSVWMRLVQDDADNIQTDADLAGEHDHEWDDNSGMICRACGHGDNVDKFETREGEVEITLFVQVSVPISLTYDDTLPDDATLRRDALANFQQHPAIRDAAHLADLQGYVDSISNGEMDLGGAE